LVLTLLLALALLLVLPLAMASAVYVVQQGEVERNKAAAETTAAVAGRRKATGGPIFPVICVYVGRKATEEV
jgi:hypothetical protein